MICDTLDGGSDIEQHGTMKLTGNHGHGIQDSTAAHPLSVVDLNVGEPPMMDPGIQETLQQAAQMPNYNFMLDSISNRFSDGALEHYFSHDRDLQVLLRRLCQHQEKKRLKPWWSCVEQVCEFSKGKSKSSFKAWECTECPKEISHSLHFKLLEDGTEPRPIGHKDEVPIYDLDHKHLMQWRGQRGHFLLSSKQTNALGEHVEKFHRETVQRVELAEEFLKKEFTACKNRCMGADCEDIPQNIERQSPRKKRKQAPNAFNSTSNNNNSNNSVQNGRPGRITLRDANRIVEYAIQTARKSNLLPTAISVVDARGATKSCQCEDGCSPLQHKIALGKAQGAIECGEGSRSLMKHAAENQSYLQALQSVANCSLIPAPGGVLIRSYENEILGAVGVASNSFDADEAVAHQAIKYAGFKPNV